MKEEEPYQPNPQHELAFRTAYLIAGYVRQTLTETEHEELDEWVTTSMENQQLFEELTDEKNLTNWLQWKEELHTEKAFERLKNRIEKSERQRKIHVRSLWPYLAAASVILAFIASLIWIQRNKITKTDNLVKTTDIAPGGNRAFLQLANGSTIYLDSIKNGSIVREGNIGISKKDSFLSYQLISPDLPATAEELNTLTTPSGGRYKLVLQDSTQVWLNAGSSLSYPTVFRGAKRKVTLTGEGYFEVAKNPALPFEVMVNGNTVEVLGTHFNINAYNNEPDLKITLAEGSVKVNHTIILKPGEQAKLNHEGKIEKMAADLETELAWKNNEFVFKQASLDELLRQVARWYNCDISYQSVITEHFNAIISRDEPVSKLLHFLEGTGSVHFIIENNKITVMK